MKGIFYLKVGLLFHVWTYFYVFIAYFYVFITCLIYIKNQISILLIIIIFFLINILTINNVFIVIIIIAIIAYGLLSCVKYTLDMLMRSSLI